MVWGVVAPVHAVVTGSGISVVAGRRGHRELGVTSAQSLVGSVFPHRLVYRQLELVVPVAFRIQIQTQAQIAASLIQIVVLVQIADCRLVQVVADLAVTDLYHCFADFGCFVHR